MSPFWIGLIIGVFGGAFLGMLGTCLLVVSKRRGDWEQWEKYG